MKNPNRPMGGWFKKYFWDIAIPISLVPSVLIAILGNENILRNARVDVGIAMVGMSSALLGIVLAGMALFVVFLDKKYVALLAQLLGMDINLEPFDWTAKIGVLCALLGMGMIILGNPSVLVFRVVFGIALFVFIYLLWQIYELVKYLAEHAKTRIMQMRQEDSNKEKR